MRSLLSLAVSCARTASLAFQTVQQFVHYFLPLFDVVVVVVVVDRRRLIADADRQSLVTLLDDRVRGL
jgi:hypothetical protein